jgi:hypothetical protein
MNQTYVDASFIDGLVDPNGPGVGPNRKRPKPIRDPRVSA